MMLIYLLVCNEGEMVEITKDGFLRSRLRKSLMSIEDAFTLGFSGGLDSSFLLFLSAENCDPCVVGSLGSKDILNAKLIADFYHRPIRIEYVPEADVIESASTITKIEPSASLTEISYDAVLVTLMKRTENEIVVTGQGSDEIFYGYSKFLDGRENSNKNSMDILRNRTLPRENKLASIFGKRLVTPYLDDEIVKTYSDLPREMHIVEGVGKMILRREAVNCGFNPEFAMAKKLAAQYGSRFQKVISNAIKTGILGPAKAGEGK